MIGYTRKVGLRKSRLHFLRTGSWPVDLELITDFDEVEVAPGVTVAAERKIREDIDKAMATVGEMPAFRHDCVCGGCDPDDGPLGALAERQEQRRRDESLRAAKAKVDALPADQRARLEGEFQRAEQEAAAIMRHGYRPLGFADDPPTPTTSETARDIWDAIIGARPCCHSTGPNHHPACQEAKQ